MIAEVLAVPLFGGASAVRLSDVSRGRRVTEMEFYFPLNLVSPATLGEVFSRHGAPVGGGGPRTPKRPSGCTLRRREVS